MTNEQATAILKELEILRKLKMAELLKAGLSQEDLAKILGVSQPTVSRMMPKVPGKKRRAGDD